MNPMQISVDGKSGYIQSNGMVSFGSDEQANVIFYNKSVLDPVKSREQGRPFYVSKEYVRIQHPGEPLNIIDRPIADDPRVIQRWPNHYQKFQNNTQQDIPDGTPLEILFPNHPEIPANLHTHAVHTVEQLSMLSAHALQSIGMGAVEWQGMARKFIDSAKGGMEHHKLVKNVEDLKSQNEVLQNQISLLKSQLDRLAAANMGIPPAMIPSQRPTQAQQHYYSAPDPVEQPTYAGPFDHDAQPQLFAEEPAKTPPTRGNRKG